MSDYRGRGLPVYTVGTISGASGQSVVAGSGTAWIGTDENGVVFNRVGAGDTLILPANAGEVTIQSVQSATQLTLERPLPVTISAGTAYRIVVRAPNPMGYINRALAALEARLARLYAEDGGQLVFRTVANGERLSYLPPGSSTFVDLLSVAGDDLFIAQGDPGVQNTAAALTAAQIAAKLLTCAPSAAITLTMPTGTALDAGFPDVGVNFSLDFAVINTSAFAVTLNGATGVTRVGTGTIAAASSNQYRLRRTAAATWVFYCLSNS